MKKAKITLEEIELVKLVYNYSLNHKLVDKDFIIKALQILLHNQKVKEEIKTIEIKKESPFFKSGILHIARHIHTLQKVTVYLNDMQGEFDLIEQTTPFLTNTERIFLKNIDILQILIHEIEHAKQVMRLKTGTKDLETTLLKISYDHLEELNQSNLKYYIYDPAERLAELNSRQEILKIIDLLKIPEVKQYENLSLLDIYLDGYKDDNSNIIAPSFYFLKHFGGLEVLHSFDFYDPSYPTLVANTKRMYEKEIRFYLGLPISKKEYEEKDKKRLKIIEKQNNRFQ